MLAERGARRSWPPAEAASPRPAPASSMRASATSPHCTRVSPGSSTRTTTMQRAKGGRSLRAERGKKTCSLEVVLFRTP